MMMRVIDRRNGFSSNAMLFSEENLLLSPLQIMNADNMFGFGIAPCIQSNPSMLSKAQESPMFPFPAFSTNNNNILTQACVREDMKVASPCMGAGQHFFPRTNRTFPSKPTGGSDLLRRMLEDTSSTAEDRAKALEIEFHRAGRDFVKNLTAPIHRRVSDAQFFSSFSTFPYLLSLPLSDGYPFNNNPELPYMKVIPLSASGVDAVQNDRTCVSTRIDALRCGKAAQMSSPLPQGPRQFTSARMLADGWSPCSEDMVLVDVPWNVPLSADVEQEYTMREIICCGAKRSFQEFTKNNLDDFIEVIVNESPFGSVDVLVHALCLVNRLTGSYPRWYQQTPEGMPLEKSEDYLTNSTHASSSCSIWSNGEPCPYNFGTTFSICNNTKDGGDDTAGGTERVKWTKSTSLRCFLAVLMLSCKFHGDIIYDTAFVCGIVDKVREYQQSGIPLLHSHLRGRGAHGGETPMLRKVHERGWVRPSDVYLRVRPSHLNKCESRVWEALGCTVWVTLQEYNACYAHMYILGQY